MGSRHAFFSGILAVLCCLVSLATTRYIWVPDELMAGQRAWGGWPYWATYDAKEQESGRDYLAATNEVASRPGGVHGGYGRRYGRQYRRPSYALASQFRESRTFK
jgi:hypothetical protein